MDTIDAPTEAFLAALADDLARQLPRAGAIGSLHVRHQHGEVALVATVLVGGGSTEARGTGDTILTAYADLRRAVPEAALTLSAEQLIFAGPVRRRHPLRPNTR